MATIKAICYVYRIIIENITSIIQEKWMSKKSALDRKIQTENYLKELGIPFIDHLPMIEEEEETKIRTPQEIAKRALVLTYLCYIGEVEEEKPEVVQFLKDEYLWSAVSPLEKELFRVDLELTPQERINISWRSECIWVLLWTIKKIDRLELPIEEVQVSEMLELLPEFMKNTTEFINTAVVREKSEIMDQSDLIYRLHWAARNDYLHQTNTSGLNPSIVEERHYAINWITNYEGLEWDDITTDT
ncbi:MAG: DUF4272 domain-containing protein [Bacteroidota bacterium]